MPSVLIVDDEPDVRLLVRYLVEKANWRVAGAASSGEEAVTRWRELRPDVIVLDQLMPGITGLETAARILAEAADQPIILFTHLRDEGLTRAATKVGIRACLSKANLHGLMPTLAGQVSGGDGS
jgi:CheY-like chemotaxis protein